MLPGVLAWCNDLQLPDVNPFVTEQRSAPQGSAGCGCRQILAAVSRGWLSWPAGLSCCPTLGTAAASVPWCYHRRCRSTTQGPQWRWSAVAGLTPACWIREMENLHMMVAPRHALAGGSPQSVPRPGHQTLTTPHLKRSSCPCAGLRTPLQMIGGCQLLNHSPLGQPAEVLQRVLT